MQLTDWLLIEVALLFIGLTKVSWTKTGFDHSFVIESPLRLQALDSGEDFHTGPWNYLSADMSGL
jgi:hypothetical protein